jgi:plasmid stability protein
VATLSIKNVPETLVKRLKSQAATNRRSLNLEVIAVLESATRATPVDVGALLARARAVRLRLKRPVSDEYIHRAKRRGRL